jgi:hypothetical protein
MNRLLGIAFMLLLVASTIVIVATTADLPARVASHFAGDGRPNGWQSLASYRVWMLAFGVLMPLFVTATIAWLPRRFPRLVNVPHKDYWLEPARRHATLRAHATFGYGVGILAALFALGMHFAVVDANATAPPALPTANVVALMIGFGVGLVALVALHWWHFRVLR